MEQMGVRPGGAVESGLGAAAAHPTVPHSQSHGWDVPGQALLFRHQEVTREYRNRVFSTPRTFRVMFFPS